MHKVLSEIIARCQRTTGLLAGAMSHGPGYHAVRIGRNIERADMTSRIVDVGSAILVAEGEEREQLDNRLWMNVLLGVERIPDVPAERKASHPPRET